MAIDPKYYGLVEMGVTFGAVAMFTVQQLWSLRDRPGADGDKPKDDPVSPTEADRD